MAAGSVKWFSVARGYGFVAAADGSGDVFLPVAAVRAADVGALVAGRAVTYEVVISRGHRTAAGVRLA